MNKNIDIPLLDEDGAEVLGQASTNAPPIMSWSTKTIAAPPKDVMKAQIAITTICFIPFLIVLWNAQGSLSKSSETLIVMGVGMTMLSLYLIFLIARQKTIFNYIITSKGASVEYHTYYPDFANLFFKGIAIAVLLLFVSMTIYTGSLWFLVGPVAMALGAARFLLSWKNKILTEKTPSWRKYNFVSIDYKRLMIITHTTDPTIGFEFRFPSKEILEQYLLILKTLLNKDVIYTEKSWEWDLSLKSLG